ncbi:hypothetical protein [Flagellimonas nanhaiensis]|uniref:Type II secretion system protein n=1 Tax=Flagellimonas nanhaiensis TaxID=2292706 RepID=A0A371JSK4_9FLAO|nr:hypothetical protein [Allomuricauda nanhaiensis]RDY60785.1 hypothetical protein DX873_00975 [Allomuricauda nanhaiensis]
MDVLKKVKASTLMETMVATVLIVVLFMMASLVLNSLFGAQVKNNTQPLKNHLRKLEYLYNHKKLNFPFYEEWEGWEINLNQSGSDRVLEFNATRFEEPNVRAIKHVFYDKNNP